MKVEKREMGMEVLGKIKEMHESSSSKSTFGSHLLSVERR